MVYLYFIQSPKESYEVTIFSILILSIWKMRHGEDAQMTQCFHQVQTNLPDSNSYTAEYDYGTSNRGENI